MPSEEATVRALAGLNLFPSSIRSRIVEDEEFRASAGIEIGRTVSFDHGVAKFDSTTLDDGIRRLYASRSPTRVCDQTGNPWILKRVGSAGQEHLLLSRSELSLRLAAKPQLDQNQQRRLAGVENLMRSYLCSPSLHARWHTKLEHRPLSSEENHRFDLDLQRTPRAVGAAIASAMDHGETKLADLVPQNEQYFLELIGGRRTSDTLAGFVESDLAPYLDHLIELDPEAGLRAFLRLCAHSSISRLIVPSFLKKVDVARLLKGVTKGGSLFSQIGLFEAVAPLADIYNEPEITGVLRHLVADKAKAKGSRFRLLSSLIAFVEGELCRTQILADWPPTIRRLASLTHASLIEEQALARVRFPEFAEQLWEMRGHAFYWQTIADVRREPRWLPDFAAPQQLRQEVLSRAVSAAAKWQEHGSPGGTLSALVFGKQKGSVARQLHVVAAFRPGPLEGNEDRSLDELTPEFEELVAKPLAGASPPTHKTFIPLLNLSGLFRIPPEHIENAVRSIQNAGHRISGIADNDSRSALFQGLAHVAAVERSAALASELRLMLRYARNSGLPSLSYPEEFHVAALAAAASSDLTVWCTSLGEWVTEIAFSVVDASDAEQIRRSLSRLCHAVPELWATAGRADAALETVVATRGDVLPEP